MIKKVKKLLRKVCHFGKKGYIYIMETTKGNTMFYNEYTKKEYAGMNIEILAKTGLKGGFLTFNQAKKLGGFIKKGSKAVAKINTPIFDNYVVNGETINQFNSARKVAVFHVSQIEFNKESA